MDADDDIIAIQEQSYHEHHFFNLNESRSSYSPSSQQRQTLVWQDHPQTQQPEQEQQRRDLLRRRRRGQTTTTTTSLLVASQEARLDASRDNSEAASVLNESSAFASLESLLEQQHFSLSLTQEKEEDDEDDEGIAAVIGNSNDNDEIRNEKPNPVSDSTTTHHQQHRDSSFLDETKEKNDSLAFDSYSIAPKNKITNNTRRKELVNRTQAEDVNRDRGLYHPNNQHHDQTILPKSHNATIDGANQNNHDIPMDCDLDNGQNHEDGHQHWATMSTAPMHHQDQQTASLLDRELQKQRERRQSLVSGKKESSSTRQHHSSPAMMEHDVEPTKALRQRLEKERHKKRKKVTRSQSSEMTLLDDPNRSFRRSGHSSRSISPKQRSPHSSTSSSSLSPKQRVPVEKAKKSIVGYRPSHWKRGTMKSSRGPLARLDTFGSRKSQQQTSQNQQQRKQLAAACTTSNILMPPPAPRRGRKSISPSPLFQPRMDSISTVSATPSPTDRAAIPISFKPEILSTNKQRRMRDESNDPDPMDIDAFDDALFMADDNQGEVTPTNATTNVSFLDTVRANNDLARKGRRKSLRNNEREDKNKHSALLRLLQGIKTEIRTDGTRLRSGEHPFPNKVTSRFDLYDPRNRAISYMDVTLLGSSFVECKSATTPRGRQQGPGNMTILGYIHNYHVFPERNVLATKGQLPLATANDSLGWICFSGETIQEHNLLNKVPQGYQLRIYNAVLFPSMISNGEEVPPDTKKCPYNILCTQLCEGYPTDILGPLQPDAKELLSRYEVEPCS